MSEPSGRSPAVYLVLGLVLGVLMSVAGAWVAWRILQPPATKPTQTLPPPPPQTLATMPAPTPEPSPVAEASASPPPAPEPEPAALKPKPPAPKPVVPPPVAALLSKAQAAVAEHKYEDAGALFDEILKQDPSNAAARAGRSAALALRKAFVLAFPSAENVKGSPGKLEGFDPGGVEVKRAAEVPGRVDLEVAPAHVKPGDRFTVKIYLINTGKKAIKIKEVDVTRTVNGSRTASSVAPRITSARGDSYLNEVVWR